MGRRFHRSIYDELDELRASMDYLFQLAFEPMDNPLLPEGETDFGLDPSWVKIYPYQILLTPGVPQTIEIRVQNYSASPMKIEAALVAPSEWRIEPDIVRLDIPARSKQAARLIVTAPKSWNAPGPRFAIAADVVRDGKYLGEITEAVVEMAV